MRKIIILVSLLLSTLVASAKTTWSEHQLAAIMVAEAGGEKNPRESMEVVAEVLVNRSKWLKKPLRSFLNSNVFSCLKGTTGVKLQQKMKAHKQYPVALEIAAIAFRYPHYLPARTNGADHYAHKSMTPYWAEGQPVVAVIGNHAFYRLQAEPPRQ